MSERIKIFLEQVKLKEKNSSPSVCKLKKNKKGYIETVLFQFARVDIVEIGININYTI